MVFSVVLNAKSRGTGHKLEHKRFSLNVRIQFSTVLVMEHWYRFPSKVVESPFLKIFKSCLDMVVATCFRCLYLSTEV